MENIDWSDFQKVEMRVGTIIEVNEFPEAKKPAYQIKVDLGDQIGIKNSSAQITDLYSKENLIGKQVITVVNFSPKQIGPFISECLITGFHRQDYPVVLAIPDNQVPNGTLLE